MQLGWCRNRAQPLPRCAACRLSPAAAPMLYLPPPQVLDYFWAQSEGQKNRAEHAGRALLYLQQ